MCDHKKRSFNILVCGKSIEISCWGREEFVMGCIIQNIQKLADGEKMWGLSVTETVYTSHESVTETCAKAVGEFENAI